MTDHHDSASAAGRRGGQNSPWEAVLLDPARADGTFLLGLVAARLGRSEAAMRWFRRTVRLQPGWADGWAALADAARRAGRWREAAAAYATLLALSPAHGAALANLAMLERAAGSPRAAVRRFTRALALDSGQAGAWNNLGNALRDLGATAQAAAAWRAALVLDPRQADALGNLGGALRDQDRYAEARVLLRRALTLAPQHAALYGVLAYALSGEGRLVEAERACRRALALTPALADPLCTLGLVEQRRGAAGALRWFDRAVAATPGHPLARFNRGLADLEGGALADGWANYACRFAAGRAGWERRFSIPEWRGEPLAGKRLFIWREQGVGDEFLFASCYADAIRQAGQVVIECERRLLPLFARSFPKAVVRAEQPLRGRPLVETVDCDLHIPAGSMPRLLRTGLADFPPRSSWLFPDPARMLDRRQQLNGIGGDLRVGIAWRSQLMTMERQWAYLPLDDWGPVLTVPGVTFVNLQYDDCEAEILRAEARFGVPIFELERLDLKNDFEGTAALIANLDLVIAPANSVAELAGALGVPVWRFGARDWTHLGSGVRPWYPSMRVFHPRAGEPLSAALGRIAAELRRAAALARRAGAEAPGPRLPPRPVQRTHPQAPSLRRH
ncbi:CHAT domain-containing protein [Azospirillum brasilense]|uniref:CHAT domain-containing protein n=1 Tax=Azospirillum brasilense TaxID=192 RepID=UPI000E6997C9|nr:tetratricopeptide repeat protein [Azospirillum brasilense]NUB26479.1 tetratricopeptide repeat protein [Azospirillum brasilense]NUB34503.1 tetratricopeptide repeat protein [Azospirillum brasilense]RIW05221.1 tetratricopeptide repeat protein [Azospirillum brasilense]